MLKPQMKRDAGQGSVAHQSQQHDAIRAATEIGDATTNMARCITWKQLAISLLVLLLVPFARVGPSVTKPIDASLTNRLELPESVIGPESVAFDPHGAGPYMSVSDGRVLTYGGESQGWKTFAYSPSYVTNNCNVSELPSAARESRCVPLSFANGDVYFTSSSTRYTRAQHQMVTATATGDSTGRIVKYDPRTSEVTVLQSDVTYPNGIAISADRTHLIVSSTGPCKLLKYWVRGPKAGTSEVFADLPGYPDNVRPDGKGGYWVALHREKYELPPRWVGSG